MQSMLRLQRVSKPSCRLFTTSSIRHGTPWDRHPPLIARYTESFPVDLFRIGASDKVILRDYQVQKKLGRTSYDLHIQEDGEVHPRPGPNFDGPNGASLRPNGPMMQEVVRNFRGRNTTIYLVKEGTAFPPDFVLLHEHSDHYSMQCAQPMTLPQLNRRLTEFFKNNGEAMTKAEFCERYPFEL